MAVMAICAVGAMAASAGGRPASPGCYPKGSTTIAQDKAGRFFHIGPSSIRGRWYVCAFKQGTPRRLPYALPNLPFTSSAMVVGRYVAFFVFFAGRGPSSGPVTVFDMVTGHRNLLLWENWLRLRQLGAEGRWLGRVDRVRAGGGRQPAAVWRSVVTTRPGRPPSTQALESSDTRWAPAARGCTGLTPGRRSRPRFIDARLLLQVKPSSPPGVVVRSSTETLG